VAKLIFTAIASLDGYVADEHGNFQLLAPDEEVHQFVNDLERPHGTYLYGRRIYEVMDVWDTADTVPDRTPVSLDYALLWQAANKVVYSTTLASTSTARTRLERRFDPDEVRRMKAAAKQDLSIGGPTLAAHAFRAGLVDEIHLLLHPVLFGGGNRALPDGCRLDLELVDERRFASGVVHLHHRVRG
jgi:dihydrofolate reductase